MRDYGINRSLDVWTTRQPLSLPVSSSTYLVPLPPKMTLISVPAGRCNRRPGTKWVDADPAKGFIQLDIEDDLLHICAYLKSVAPVLLPGSAGCAACGITVVM
jgi:hypothetical protein